MYRIAFVVLKLYYRNGWVVFAAATAHICMLFYYQMMRRTTSVLSPSARFPPCMKIMVDVQAWEPESSQSACCGGKPDSLRADPGLVL